MKSLIEHLSVPGARSKLAREIGVNPQLISQWIHKVRPIPAARCPDIEAATGGKVRCEDLRPDVAWHVLRQQAATSAASASPCAEPPAGLSNAQEAAHA